MAVSYESERNHLIALVVVLGFVFLISLVFIQMFSAVRVMDLVAWSNYYFELCALIVGLNLFLLLFYNVMVERAKVIDKLPW